MLKRREVEQVNYAGKVSLDKVVQKQVAVEEGRDVVIGDIEPLSNLPLGLSALNEGS